MEDGFKEGNIGGRKTKTGKDLNEMGPNWGSDSKDQYIQWFEEQKGDKISMIQDDFQFWACLNECC